MVGGEGSFPPLLAWSMTVDYQHFQSLHLRVSADSDVAAADTAKDNVVAVKDSNHRIYVQKITVSVITDAAQSLIFQDDANTPVLIAKTKATPGLGPIVFDFGVNGTPLTKGKNLDIATSGAGVAARVHVEGYQKLEGTISM